MTASVVKSAARVIEMLEYFDSVRVEATIMDIARALDYPQSSTSVLVRSLVELGYLQHGVRYRAYRPTPRVTLLGAWIEPMLAPDGAIVRLMNELGDATGETIILASEHSTVVRYIYVVPASTAMRLHVGPGTLRPTAYSGAGRVFMSRMSEDRVRWLVHRFNEEHPKGTPRLYLTAVRRDLAAIRADGYCVSYDRITQGAGIVAAPLPVTSEAMPLVVGIGGLSQTIRAKSALFSARILDAIRRHFDAVPASQSAGASPRSRARRSKKDASA